MANEQQDELAQLRLAIERLAQGLQLVSETQERHSEMLRQILLAASAPEPKESGLNEALAAVAAGLRDQITSLNGVQRTLAQLPAEVGVAVTRSLQAALAEP